MNDHSIITLAAESKIKVPEIKTKENLKQRAYLNSLSSFIDYAGVQITGFFINPFLVSGLGTSMYGIWQMLAQLTGYTKISDTRASQVLKWTLANQRDIAKEEEFKSYVTTALIITAFTLPLSLLIGGFLSWYAPYITQADEQNFDLIRLTCAILISCIIVNKFFDLFESVLAGMNLGYKRMGLRVTIVAVAGMLKILAIINGYGLIGLSVVQIFVSLVTGFSFYFIVKKNVPWFAFGKTNFSKIKSFGKLSGWYMAFSTLKMFLLNSDKVILGYLLGPVIVARYALTMFTSAAVQGALLAIITGMTPGICSLFGKGEFEKVTKARETIMTLIWLFSVSIGVSILFLNESFLKLWVGGDRYAGSVENLFILLVTLQTIFFQLDSCILNTTGDVRRKVWLSACSTILSVILAFILVTKFQIIGLCISFLIGRLFYSIGFPVLLNRSMNKTTSFFSAKQVRLALATVLLFAFATYGGTLFRFANWPSLIAGGIVTVIITGCIFWMTAISVPVRAETWKMISGLRLFKIK